jgi:hypothetical protein
MSKAVGSRARILVNKTLNSGALDHIMGVWFGVLALTALFVGLSPAPEAMASVSPQAPVVRSERLSAAERHCMVQTALGEATPGHKAEVIAIMRGMLARRASGRWGNTICSVVKAPRQYSVWNDRKMPGKPKKPGKLYKRYSQWADVALAAGPSRFKFYWHGKAMRKLYKKPRPYWAKSCVETVKVGGATMCRMGRNNS